MTNLRASVPSAHIILANKDVVDELLAMNTSNRKLRGTAVERLKDDILNNEWMLTASGIGVDSEGKLSDGQHRLEAIRAAGYPPVPLLLVVGLSPDAQGKVDRHAKRSLSDAMSLEYGRTIGNQMVAACNVLLMIAGATDKSTPFSNFNKTPSDGRTRAAFIEWGDDIEAVLKVGGNAVRASVTAAVAVYHRHDSDGAKLFVEQLKRGLGLQEDDPAYRLRLALDALTKGGSQASFKAFCLSVSAALAHANGKKIKLLRPSDSWSASPWKKWKA